MEITKHRLLIDYSTSLQWGIEPVRKCACGSSCAQSPFLVSSEAQRVGAGRDIQLFPEIMSMYKVIVGSVQYDGSVAGVAVQFVNTTTGNDDYPGSVDLALSDFSDPVTLRSSIVAKVIAWASSQLSVTVVAGDFVFPYDAVLSLLPAAPSSYQTIVSQTGTSAPAVSGSLVPVNTYAGSPTFTWARTGAGVYTLTASSAVFNTSGKTGVFFGALNNLNASCKAVVTSSTVITVTTAIGSLLGLGLLGFTATPTDALLTQTMVYVQTYS